MLRTHALTLVAPHARGVLAVILLTLAPSLLGAVDPLVLKSLFDSLEHHDSRLAILSLGLVFAAEVVRDALGAWGQVKTWDLRLAVDVSLRDRLVHKLTTLSSEHHHAEGVGASMNRMAQCVASFTNTLIELALNLLPPLGYLAVAVVAMWGMHWQLALVVLAFAPLGPLIGVWASHEQVHRERRLMEWWNRVYARLNEMLSGLRLVKIFATEHAERARFTASLKDGNVIVARGVRRDALTGFARTLTVALARAAVLGAGGWLIFDGQLTLGALVAFLAYVGGILGPVQQLTGLYQTMRKGVVAMEMMTEILDAPEEVPDREGALALPRGRGELRFHDVSFTPRPGHRVLERFSLHVKPGETVALIGPSGSGKSTVVNLLLRLLSPESGSISLDGVDIASVTAQSLRQNIATVTQDVHLFNDTVRANIAYARPDATDQQIEQAARAAQAHEFIVSLPQGYDTPVGEHGGRLTGGQRQRLAIARALLKDAPILVLDEATSALDGTSAAFIHDSLHRLFPGRTTLFTAHRPSSAVNADRIVVLQAGRILATGTHAQLLASCPFYAQLVGSSPEGTPERARLELARLAP